MTIPMEYQRVAYLCARMRDASIPLSAGERKFVADLLERLLCLAIMEAIGYPEDGAGHGEAKQ